MPNAAQQRASSVLSKLAGTNNPKVVEIGVFVAAMSVKLLKRSDLLLSMVDSWSVNHTDAYHATNDFHAKLSAQKQENYFNRSVGAVSPFQDRAKVIRLDSLEAVKLFDDGELDLVFIDADHSYEGCIADIRAWMPKIKKGGYISGHDYENNEGDFKFGVTRAVNEMFEYDQLEFGDNYTWFVRL